MKAKEPCIDCPNINLDDYGYLCDLFCGKRTAWLNYMAGVREVVEFAIHFAGIKHNPEWKTKLEEWGVKVCARCSAIRTDDIDSDICGSCADDLRMEAQDGQD